MIIIVKHPTEENKSKNIYDPLIKKYDLFNYKKYANYFNNIDNTKAKEIKNMINNCIWVKDEHANENTLEDTKAKVTVYPDPRECKTLIVKTKSGYKAKVYEVMYINDMKLKCPVYYNEEGERL